jgi:glutathione S-transferase
MLAATMTKFVQKTINDRSRYLSLEQTQLPFGELPLLQIDNLEIVQSQACIRYLAVRGGLQGCAPEDTLKCDMIAEACRDLIDLACEAPFKKFEREDIGKEHVEVRILLM